MTKSSFLNVYSYVGIEKSLNTMLASATFSATVRITLRVGGLIMAQLQWMPSTMIRQAWWS